MSFKPQLPPRTGYVEQTIDGKHVYLPTAETIEKERLASENNLLKAQVQALTNRNDFVEDCVAEMAMQVYQ